MNQFRQKFVLPHPIVKWFPGHMVKGMRDMQKNLKNVDCIIEIHDARIPFTGRNMNFKQAFTSAKPHLMILNKVDLADTRYQFAVERKLVAEGVNSVLYTELSGRSNSKACNYNKILPTLLGLMRNSDRFHRNDSAEFNVMVIGVPNVGKSCLINRLRQMNVKKRGSATPVGAIAGMTTSVLTKIRVCTNPPIFILDTPGILAPGARNVDEYMKLGIISALSDDTVGMELLADYLLYWLNKEQNFSYVDYFGLEEPIDNISELLFKIALKSGSSRKIRLATGQHPVSRPDFLGTAQSFVSAFRRGDLGKFFLDMEKLDLPEVEKIKDIQI